MQIMKEFGFNNVFNLEGGFLLGLKMVMKLTDSIRYRFENMF